MQKIIQCQPARGDCRVIARIAVGVFGREAIDSWITHLVGRDVRAIGRQRMSRRVAMRQLIKVLVVAGIFSCLMDHDGWGGSGSLSGTWGPVPNASSSAGPALAGYEAQLFIAWTGKSSASTHRVWFSSYNGSWMTQKAVAGSSTSTAPALAVAAQQLFMAATSPTSGGDIEFYRYNGSTFVAIGAICQAIICAQTLAAPTLAGNGATLYAAWTTPAGAIRYAVYANGAWTIAPAAIPHALSNPDNAPSLTVFNNRLYAAWTVPAGGAIQIASTPLTSTSWTAPAQITASTDMAPTLASLYQSVGGVITQELYVSFTTSPGSAIDFEEYQAASNTWSPVPSPVPLPSPPLTLFPAALSGSPLDISGTSGDYNAVAYTDLSGNVDVSGSIIIRQP